MAKARQPVDADRVVRLVEAMVNLQQRGRSVINGTMLVGDEVRTFSHELTDDEKHQFRELIARALSHHWQV